MTVATPSSLKTQILAGTYPDNTLSEDNVFDYEQYEGRRKYPSCEIVTTQPESTTETAKQTDIVVSFEIRYYAKNLGVRTDEVAGQKSVEDVIIAQIESFTLQDHKIVFESKSWSRQQVARAPGHPSYIVSVLKITVRQVTTATITPVGSLSFRHATSSVDNNPGSNYTYSNVFDVDFTVGYNDVEESYVGSNIKRSYTGDLRGNFICSILVNDADLGSTGDKLNKMPTIRTTGEKGVYAFQYLDKSATGSTLTHDFIGEVDRVQILYRTNEGTVFRLYVRLLSVITITVT